MANFNNIPDFRAMAEELISELPTEVSVQGLNFFTDSFHNQGFTDVALEPWKPRADQDGGKTLVRSSFLMGSLEVIRADQRVVEIATYAPYAEIHNSGGTIPVSSKMSKYFWMLFYRTNKIRFKYMAMAKYIKIPKRQFIGESQALINQLDGWVIREIITRFNNIKMTK